MTVDVTDLSEEYTGNDSTPTYSHKIPAKTVDELLVTVTDTEGVTTSPAFTLVNPGTRSGGITLTAGNLPSGHTLSIKPSLAIEQVQPFGATRQFNGAAHEQMADRLTYLVAQVSSGVLDGVQLRKDGDGDAFLGDNGLYNPIEPATGATGVVFKTATVASLKATDYQPEMLVNTREYNAGTNVGSSPYRIKTAAQAAIDGDIIDGYGNHALANGNVAIIQAKGVVNITQFGAVAGQESTNAIQSALNSSASAVYIPAHPSAYIVSSTLTWPRHIDVFGAGPRQSTIQSNVDGFTFDNPSTSGRSLGAYRFGINGNLALPNNAGIRVFDNDARPIDDLLLGNITKQTVVIKQSVNSHLSKIRVYASSAASAAIEIDKGATSIVSPYLSQVYVSGPSAVGILLTGARNFTMDACVAESCDVGFRIDSSDGQIKGGWLESNTVDIDAIDSPYVRKDVVSTSPTWNASFSGSTEPRYRMTRVATAGTAFLHNADDRAASLITTWEDVLFSSQGAYYGSIPSGFDSVSVDIPGLWVVDYAISFRSAAAGAESVGLRVTKNGTEVPGSFASATIQPGDVINLSRCVTVDASKDDVFKVQFTVSSTSVVIGKASTGIAAPDSTTNAAVTLSFLGLE